MLANKNIGINFGGLKALDNVTFDVQKTGITALIGPNGAGKTTLFNIITGFLTGNTGNIVFEGEDITNYPPYKVFEKGIARTFQNLNLIRELTLEENLLLGLIGSDKPSALKSIFRLNKSYWKNVQERIEKTMETTGIEEWRNKNVSEMPYGILKNLEMARAILSEPKMLLLDEPAAGLNNNEKDNLVNLVVTLKEKGMSVFMVEHDMSFVSTLAEKVVCLNYGRVIASGTYGEIRNNEDVIKAYLGDTDA